MSNPDNIEKRGADRLAYECAKTITNGKLDSRSGIADALLDYLSIGTPNCPTDVPTWMKSYEQTNKLESLKEIKELPTKQEIPNFNQYAGGGVILSPSTPIETIKMYCGNCESELQIKVLTMLSDGYEVIIHHGTIKAAQLAWRSEHYQQVMKKSLKSLKPKETHEWEEIESQYSSEERVDVRCIKCGMRGEKTIKTGEVFYPAT
jgi:hypothetical protein